MVQFLRKKYWLQESSFPQPAKPCPRPTRYGPGTDMKRDKKNMRFPAKARQAADGQNRPAALSRCLEPAGKVTHLFNSKP
jgi:hypothetical protein